VTPLTTTAPPSECWNVIGVRGDHSCPELAQVVHCHNCPVFAAAGRRFLDAPSPPGYLEEWTERLAAPTEEIAADRESALVFRLADEWLALPVRILVEVTTLRPVHRVPHRAGLLAGLVNIRGELYLCAHLEKLLGADPKEGPREVTDSSHNGDGPPSSTATPDRLLVTRRDADRWVFRVDAVEKVVRVARDGIGPPPATVGRSAAHLSRGVFAWEGRTVGLLDDERMFDALRARLR
jgi:chemotaxis-related protein WspD